MEIKESKHSVNINKLVGTKKEFVIIEGDVIVPDVKPDILNTIDTVGNINIYKKEVLDSKVRFDGSINLNVIYLADSEIDTIRGLTTTLDFTQIIEIDNCKKGMELRNNMEIKEIECSVINGRKINIKVGVEIEVYIYSNEKIEFLKEINNIDGIQTLNSNMKINNLVGTGCCRVTAKDTISIAEEDKLSEILKFDIDLKNSETKASYNKVLIKADACVKIMYLTEEGDIKVISNVIPIMGFIDMLNVSEDNLISCQYEIKNILLKPNTVEQHSIYVEIEYEICCDALSSIEIEAIQDMYCLNSNLIIKQKNVNTIANKRVIKNICNINERISIPEISSNQIYDVEVKPKINNENVLNGKIVYEGDIQLNFIFSSDKRNGIDTKKYILPFTYNVDNENVNQNKNIKTNVKCVDDEFIVKSDGMIDCKLNIEFENEIYENTNVNIIDEVEVIEDNNNLNPSMVVYIVKEGDSIWKIAKEHKTTMQEIININNLDNGDEIFVGEKLFIPRFYINKVK